MADNKIQVLLEVDDKGTASLQRFQREVQTVGRTGATSFGQVTQASTATTTSLTGLGTAAKAMGTALAAVGVANFARSVLDTTIQIDSMQRAMTAIYGSSQAAAAEMEFLRATADRTGQNVYKLVDSYNQLSASTKDTALEGENTRKVFAAMSEAASVLGMSNETASRAFVALSQMASKGVISMEEMRQQLGEALPGALNLFAKGMGIGVGELTEMISKGKVGAEELTKFADAVHQAYGEAAETAALESAQSAMNKMEEAWTDFKLAVSDTGTIVGAIHLITDTIKAAQSAVEAFAAAWNSMLTLYADGMPAVAGAFSGSALEGHELALKRIEIATGKVAEKEAEIARIRANIAEQGYTSPQQSAAIERLTGDLDKLKLTTGEAHREIIKLAPASVKTAVSVRKASEAAAGAAESKKGLANASKDAEKAAKALAAEQKRLADEAERTGRAMIEDAAKRRELTAELTKNLTDTSAAYETLGIASRKSYEDQVKAATDAYERILSIEDLTDSERLRLREALQKGLIKLEDDYRGKVEETTGAITAIWTDLTEDTKQVLHDWVENAIKMEFDSVGEAFESLAKAMLDVWIDMIAKMIAEWVGSGLLGLFTGQGLGGFGAAGGSLIGKGFEKLFGGGTVGTLADWGLTAAGTSSVIGGGTVGTLADWGLTAAGTSSVIGGGASSLLGGGASSAAFDWGLNSFGAPALGGGAAAGAATLFGEQAAAGFTAGMDTAMAGGLEWVAIPGKEFFGTGASGAAGGAAGAGLSTGAMVGGGAIMGLGALIAMGMGGKAQQEFYSPRYGNVSFKDYGHDDRQDMIRAGQSGYNWVSDAQPGSISGSGDAGITQTVADLERAFTQFEQNTRVVLDVLAAAGDGVASLGQQLEDGKLSTDAFVDAIAGYDVSIQDTANLTSLASDAARGNGNAMDALRAALQSMGLGADQAEVAALSLVAASNNQSSALYAAATAASTAAGAISGMVSNINTLSSTPLNIRVGAEPYRIDNFNPYAEHAAGGIFASPTLIPSVRGTRHLVGESGAEAITPLHAGPGTLKAMHDDIKAIAGRPVTTIINLDGREIGRAVLPMVDAHVAAKAGRGALGKRTVY